MRRGLARVSSKEQATNSHSLENQIQRLKAAGCEKIYTDVGSGFKTNAIRRDFDQLMLDVETGDEVVVTNLDRLSRNEVVSFMVFDSFEEKNVRLISLDQPYLDLSNPDLRLLAGYSVLEARAYSARLSRSSKRGHKAHRDRSGAYNPCFGYKVVEEKYYLNIGECPDLPSGLQGMTIAAVARDLVEIFLTKKSVRSCIREINRKYGVRQSGRTRLKGLPRFGTSALVNWLTNPVLRGHTCYGRTYANSARSRSHNWDIRAGTHAPLISELEYQEIEEILTRNASLRGYGCKESQQVHPLSGLVYCGACDGKCRVISSGSRSSSLSKKTYYYQCSNYHMGSCRVKQSVKYLIIESAVNNTLVTIAKDIAAIAQSPMEYMEPPQLQQLRSQLLGLSALGDNPAIVAAKNDLQRQIDEVKHQLSVKQLRATDDIELLKKHFSDSLFWETLHSHEKQLVYRKLIEKVVITDGIVVDVIPKV